MVIQEEAERSKDSQSTYSPEQMLFVCRQIEGERDQLALLTWLVNNFINCFINISIYNRIDFDTFLYDGIALILSILVSHSYWSSGEIINHIHSIPISLPCAITIFNCIQQFITNGI